MNAWSRVAGRPAADGGRPVKDSACPMPVSPRRVKVSQALGAAERAFTRCTRPEHQLALDLEFCAEVARFYESAKSCPGDRGVAACYLAFAAETAAQFEAVTSAGIAVRPWLREGQPYAGSGDLRERVTATGTLYVYLTRCGHGPPGTATPGHPMCASSGVVIDGERLLCNDLFRAVHDAFGHVLHGNGFGLAGELQAARSHLCMYTPSAAAALLTETVAQTCWFYAGPHVLTAGGLPARPGTPQYVPPRSRPFPQQKAVLFDTGLTARFLAMFEGAAR